MQTNFHTERGTGRLPSHRPHALGASPLNPQAVKQGHGDGKPNIQTKNFEYHNGWTEFTLPQSPAPECLGRRASKSVGPFHSWSSQIKKLFKAERKHESLNPRNSIYKDRSVSRHAHLSPADASQSSVDTLMRKEDVRISMPKLPQRGNSVETALSRRLSKLPHSPVSTIPHSNDSTLPHSFVSTFPLHLSVAFRSPSQYPSALPVNALPLPCQCPSTLNVSTLPLPLSVPFRSPSQYPSALPVSTLPLPCQCPSTLNVSTLPLSLSVPFRSQCQYISAPPVCNLSLSRSVPFRSPVSTLPLSMPVLFRSPCQ